MTAGPLPAVNLRGVRSADWRRVLDAALRPQLVQAALNLERRAQPHIPFERLAIVADLFDEAHGPRRAPAELCAERAFGSAKPLALRMDGFQRLTALLR